MIYLNDLEEIHNHPDFAHVPRRMLDYWHSYRRSSNLPLATRETRKKEIRKYQELTGLLHRAGVPLLAGTDTPEPFVPPGYSACTRSWRCSSNRGYPPPPPWPPPRSTMPRR